jgi:hypothetical protein
MAPYSASAGTSNGRMSMVDNTASTLRVSRADCRLAAPYRSSAAVMILTQIPPHRAAGASPRRDRPD